MKNEIPVSEPVGPNDLSVEKHLHDLREFVSAQLGVTTSQERSGDCEIVTALVKEYFDIMGIENKIYGGDIPVGPGDYLSHRINFVFEGESVWVIDLTSKQLPWLSTSDWIIEKINNEPSEVWAFMDRVYPGWA
jgi:hypothetical protein